MIITPQVYGCIRLRKRAQAERLSISVRCLENWMTRGIVPYTRIGNVVIFDPVAVDEALQQFEVKGSRRRSKQASSMSYVKPREEQRADSATAPS